MARPKVQVNRKEDIIKAAEKLFAEKSFEKTTIEEIAKLAGISKGSFYLEFKNKEEILKSMAKVFITHRIQENERAVSNAKPPYLDLLKQIVHEEILYAFEKASLTVRSYITQMNTCYQVKQDLNDILQKRFSLYAKLLEMAEKNGEIQCSKSYKDLSYLINIATSGFYPPYDFKYSIEQNINLSREDIRKVIKEDSLIVIELILSGLKK
jgi:AcrR family transcriptional regulator